MHCFSFQALILQLSGLRSCIFNEESIQAVLLENSCLTSFSFFFLNNYSLYLIDQTICSLA